MAGGERLPVPSHDTFLFYIADRFESDWKRMNFKKDFGFDQSKNMEHLQRRLKEVEEANAQKPE